MIFSPEWMVSQIKLYQISCINCIAACRFGTNVPFYHYDKTTFGEPDFSRRLLIPNGRLWDLVLTGKEVDEGSDEVLEIEQTLKKWKVVKK